ncbi:sulfite exporter TauE/SafE family protein [Micromonospora olivasterospora]|uniref:Probable membrane transporter protein n=1 Tax=Micromonospora olivasterospora TaxID=1880 RepID=A0A562IHB1_MICOL|nr:TSUP family transporter [Micromonospora olivasterospora]TWH70282.1 hypothetical protein JD77_05305 [Micromonospora olivasterospora]
MDPLSLTTLLAAAAMAGWVDAVVGGGGLLLLPALLVAAPGVPVAMALGTNKLAAIFGTSTAAVTYGRRTKLDWRVAGPAAGLAVLFVLTRPRLGVVAHPHRRTGVRVVVAVAVAGLGIALYDGLIGPGTGTFLVLAFTALIGADFVHASAMAKVVNAGTNLGALVVFAATGHVWWLLGAAMAVCNVAGAALGARMALRRGSGFVRVVLLVVVGALVAKLGYDQWRAA